MKIRPEILYKICIFTTSVFVLLTGCNTRHESNELAIVFVSLLESEQGYGSFAVKNTTFKTINIETVRIIDTVSGDEMPSNLLKLTNRHVEPNGWEYGVFQTSKSSLKQGKALRIEYNRTGKRLFGSNPINTNDSWIKHVYPSEDYSFLYAYVLRPKTVDKSDIVGIDVRINDVKADVSDFSVLPTVDEQFLVCLKITPPRKLNGGERVFVQVAWDNKMVYGGYTKIFFPFVAGPTQYSKVMRSVDIEYEKDSIRLNIYNRLVRKLGFEFEVEYSTDEIHSQEVSFSSVAIPFAHDFECFDSGVDVFNDNSFL